MSRDNVKTEASMPVQTRVDLRTLAELSTYWDRQGMYIGTMSRLISWSLDALRMILDKNGEIENKVSSLEMAYDILSSRGMLQASLKKRMEAKFAKSRAMENLRFEGWNAKEVGGRFYEELHPENEVKPFPKRGQVLTQEEREYWEEQLKKGDALRTERNKADIERQKKRAMNDPHIIKIDEPRDTTPAEHPVDVEEQTRKYKQKDQEIAEAKMMPPVSE